MKTLLLITLLLSTFTTSAAAACGSLQPIYGRVLRNVDGIVMPVRNATVRLTSPEGKLIETRRTNPFGYYRFEVLPCSSYSVRAVHKVYVFLPEPISASEFKGKGVLRNLWEMQLEN
jgi:hypothetical protein